MAYREYIGSRYVPIFGRIGEESIQWDNSKPYEPLTIVLHEGNSFTSRQYVPIGIDIDNAEYWAETGNFNAQIEQYRQEVLTFDDRLDAIESDNWVTANRIASNAVTTAKMNDAAVTSAKISDGAVTTAKMNDAAVTTAKISDGAVTTAKMNDATVTTAKISDGAVTTAKMNNAAVTTAKISDKAVTPEKLSSGVNAMFMPYAYFKGHNIFFVGDSYTNGTGASETAKRFASLLATKLEGNAILAAKGGTGFVDEGTDSSNLGPFTDIAQRKINTMTTDDINDVHLVIIAGGVNDYRDTRNFTAQQMLQGAYDVINLCVNTFANAYILVVPMLFQGHDATVKLDTYETQIIRACNFFNGTKRVRYIKGAWTWNFGIASRYNEDALHPTDSGYQEIANHIYAMIQGGECYSQQQAGFTFESGFSSGDDIGQKFIFDQGIVSMYPMKVNNTNTLAANNNTKVGTSTAGFMNPAINVFGFVSKYTSAGIVGIWNLTSSGALYVKCNQEVTGDIVLQPVSYKPFGVLK